MAAAPVALTTCAKAAATFAADSAAEADCLARPAYFFCFLLAVTFTEYAFFGAAEEEALPCGLGPQGGTAADAPGTTLALLASET